METFEPSRVALPIVTPPDCGVSFCTRSVDHALLDIGIEQVATGSMAIPSNGAYRFHRRTPLWEDLLSASQAMTRRAATCAAGGGVAAALAST
jgi:hypothetical protein